MTAPAKNSLKQEKIENQSSKRGKYQNSKHQNIREMRRNNQGLR